MVSHALEFCLDDSPPVGARWPFLASRPVLVGGVTVTYGQAESALRVLAASGGAAVAQVLRAAGNPLAGCDYRRAAAPFMTGALAAALLDREGLEAVVRGRGAAGFPAVKRAFMAAVRVALGRVEAAEPARHHAGALAAARAAFGRDFGYAEAMARAAVVLREREHVARLRGLLAAGVSSATAACRAAGPGSDSYAGPCMVSSACGTGGCRFASGVLAEVEVPAGPGRLVRPPAHARAAGGGFGLSAAAAELAVRVPLAAGVHARSADSARAADRACA